jgi:hypothetical protein
MKAGHRRVAYYRRPLTAITEDPLRGGFWIERLLGAAADGCLQASQRKGIRTPHQESLVPVIRAEKRRRAVGPLDLLQLKALDHLGLKVRDLEKSLQLLSAARPEGPPDERADAAGVRMAVLQVGNQELNVACHPDFTPPGKDNAVASTISAFEVEAASMDEVVADLKRAGIEIAGGPTARRDGAAPLPGRSGRDVRVELQLKRPTTPGSGTGER